MKKHYLLLILLIFPLLPKAQISSKGTPKSFLLSNKKSKLSKIPVVKLPELNIERLLLEDLELKKSSKRLKPLRYAKMIPVNFHLKNSGKWETLQGNDKLWRLAIHSPKAHSIEVIFDKYYLPPGAQVFIYNEDKSHVLGAFTHRNNKENNKLPVSPIKGDKIIIEYYEPANVKFPGILSIGHIGHAYKNILNHLKSYGSSGACNIDINCTEGDNWQNEKQSVCKITFNGYICSGALINNTSFDETPYFLTAHHCIDSEYDAENTIFYFDYENATCGGTIEPAYQTIAGSSLIATTGVLDFSLIKISSLPPASYQAYYAGWNKKDTAASKGVCIHHPDGDVKKITIENDSLLTGNFGGGFDINSHWWIKTWETGTTEGGSSGSPIFDQNHQIVGDLTGGDASCSNNVNDYFAKFSRSWADYPFENQQLKFWLDPTSTGVDTLQGLDPAIPNIGKDALLLAILNPLDSNYNILNTNPKVIFKSKGSETLTSLDINYQIDGGSIITEAWSGNLDFNQQDTITFTNIVLTSGDHIFKSYCSSPNGGTDTIPQNDTLSMNYFVSYNLDAKLDAILSPSSTYCNEPSISPQVQIKNLGNTTLTSVNINYQIDGGSIVSEPWTGSLSQLQTAIVTLNEITVDLGNYIFKAFVSAPNGGSDMKNDNDSLEMNYNITSGEKIRLSLTTDNYGNETSWAVTNSLSQVIYSGSNYNDNIIIEEDFCLEEDCYNFTILDSEDDGICCDYGFGEYTLARVKEDFPHDTIKIGGEFEGKDSAAFCIPLLYPDFTADSTLISEYEIVQYTNLSLEDESSVSYLWTFEGGTPATSSEENPIVMYNTNGSYDVSLTITDTSHDLSKSESNFITVSASSKKEILIHPIPSNDGMISINAKNLDLSKLTIFNTLGELILKRDEINNFFTLNLSEFKNGIYVLKLYSNEGEHSSKIIIMK